MTNEWEVHPHLFMQDKDGNFILKKDGTPKRKPGRAKQTDIDASSISEQKAQVSAKRSIKNKETSIKKLEEALYNKRRYLKKQKQLLGE